MANDEEDLRINTLNALTKQSPFVVLEEHSHCEVPAGCGGVVLRWRDPNAGEPGVLRVAGLVGRARAWLDGTEVVNTWLSLLPGRHVLAIELTELPSEPTPCIALVTHQRRDEVPPLLLSTVGHDWRVHPGDPPTGWTAPDFDDTAWSIATDATDLVEALSNDQSPWRFRGPMRDGATPLRATGPRFAVRATFVIGGGAP
ncbi:MAG: hypothetical protein KTR31_41210 [Myxococcales bacterium]|nr:hypothetical protein [Myxococcales bacterium]